MRTQIVEFHTLFHQTTRDNTIMDCSIGWCWDLLPRGFYILHEANGGMWNWAAAHFSIARKQLYIFVLLCDQQKYVRFIKFCWSVSSQLTFTLSIDLSSGILCSNAFFRRESQTMNASRLFFRIFLRNIPKYWFGWLWTDFRHILRWRSSCRRNHP